MPQPDRQQYIDVQLTEFSQAYVQSQDAFIASRAFRPLTVKKESAKYNIFDKNAWLQDNMQIRPNGGESAGGGFSVSNDSYNCETFALHKLITRRDRANWTNPNITIEEAAVQWLTQQGLQKLERQWVANCFAAGKWANDPTPNNLWSDYSASDPISDIMAGKEAVLLSTGQEVNVGIVGWQVWRQLQHHPDFLSRVTGTGSSTMPAKVARQALAEILELEEILVAKAVGATNVENETAATSFVAGKHMLLLHRPQEASDFTPAAGYTFMWDGVADGSGTIAIYQIEDNHKGLGTVKIEIEMAFDHKITGSDLGYLIEGAVS